MFVFNITMEQLVQIRKDYCDFINSTHIRNRLAENIYGICFNAKRLSFSTYMLGYEWDDLCCSDFIVDSNDVNTAIGYIVSLIGRKIGETEAEGQMLEDELFANLKAELDAEEKARKTAEEAAKASTSGLIDMTAEDKKKSSKRVINTKF